MKMKKIKNEYVRKIKIIFNIYYLLIFANSKDI